jgi:serine/threonine protein kinase
VAGWQREALMDRNIVETEADRYIIDEYLAEGGMGAIYLGRKLGLGGFEKQVVLKQLLPEYTSNRQFIDLFLREAKLSASLDHANIVHTLDLVAAGDEYFIVMEHVRGGDLRTLLRRIKRRGRRLEPAAALFIAREVLSALAYAHDKRSPDGRPLRLIHRDISPSNIMLSAAGEVKLTDFGIAKAATHRSVFYRVKGKMGYMSPEQTRGEPLDQRSDLYSVAVCLYEMVAGGRLFVVDPVTTADQLFSQPVPPLEGRPGVPLGLDRVLARALAQDPDQRYQSALELQDGLVRVAYDNAMVYSPPELAQHLKQVCGPDTASWQLEVHEDPAGPGTELLEQEASHLSGVELTSIFPRARPPDDGAPNTEVEIRDDPTRPPEAPPGGPQIPVPMFDLGRLEVVPAAGPREDESADPTTRLRPLSRELEQDSAPTQELPAPAPEARPTPGQGRLAVVIGAVALLGAAAIAAVVGLTGPDLSEPRAAPVHAVLPDATSAVAAFDPDAASLPDVHIPPPPDAAHQQPAGATGQLRINSSPPDARVLLDRVYQCQSPCTVEGLQQNRVYLLSIRRKDHLPWSALVDLRNRPSFQISAFLTPRPTGRRLGRLQIRSTPPAEVFIDGRQVGWVTSEGPLPLPPGTYEVTLSHPHHRRRPRHIATIRPRQTVTLTGF